MHNSETTLSLSRGAFHRYMSSFDRLCPEFAEGLRMTFIYRISRFHCARAQAIRTLSVSIRFDAQPRPFMGDRLRLS
jgi:hypothetical protein